MNISYKCKNCGSSMEYDAGTDSLVCMHCGNREKVKDIEREGVSLGTPEEGEIQLYSCPNCGAKLMADVYTAATVCAYCGSPVVLAERVSDDEAPQYVIPFKIGRKDAKEIYRKWTKSGFFTPKVFSSESVLNTIAGTYVPYWLYDCRVRVDMTADATRTETQRTKSTEKIYTHHYRIEREIDTGFERIPADASEKMPDEIMDRLEPFDYNELDSFRVPYLSGYQAEIVNGPSEAYSERAAQRAVEASIAEAKETIKGYNTVTVLKESHEIYDLSASYAMLPVWVLNYHYRGKDWQLYLNGQTGKKIGSLPVNPFRVALTFLGIGGAVFGIVMGVMTWLL